MSERERNAIVLYSPAARKDLQKLDRKDARRIVAAIHANKVGNPLAKAKPLSGIFEGLYRYRVGDYRVIFSYTDEAIVSILTVLKIRHRKDAYRI